MSDGLRDSLRWQGLIAAQDDGLCCDRDAIDGRDPWDDEEITEVIRELDRKSIWHDLAYKPPKCTCGAEKTYGPNTTHSNWCDKK